MTINKRFLRKKNKQNDGKDGKKKCEEVDKFF